VTHSLIGSCLCRGVAYEVNPPFIRFVHCYCSRCRKSTGSGRASNIVVLPEQLRWLEGETLLVRFDLPEARSFATTFCSKCGSPLPHLTRSGREVIVPAGSLDQEPMDTPSAHFQWSSRAKWISDNEAHLPHVE
jgi:hypothetical protein